MELIWHLPFSDLYKANSCQMWEMIFNVIALNYPAIKRPPFLFFIFHFKQRYFPALEDMKCRKVFALSLS